jgi:lipoprotein signal peptidase
LGNNGYTVDAKGTIMMRAMLAGTVGLPRAGRRTGRRPWPVALAPLAMVIVLDQAMKWWAWRHVSGTAINFGGNFLVGHTVSQWYADPVTGALLDLLDVGLLSVAVSVLVRRRRPVAFAVFGALMVGGWVSNLLDRLVMHYLTAPDSIRGAVDFIQIGTHRYNVADFFIVGATPVFLLAAGRQAWRPANGPATTTTTATAVVTRSRRRVRTQMSALAGTVGLGAVVALGAVNYGGVTTPPPAAGAPAQHQYEQTSPASR